MSKRVPATKAERAHLLRIKTLPCCVCGWPPISEAHHICDARGRLGHYFTLPLCHNCHDGHDGFKGMNRKAWDKSLENQLALLGKTCKLLMIEMPPYQTKVVSRK